MNSPAADGMVGPEMRLTHNPAFKIVTTLAWSIGLHAAFPAPEQTALLRGIITDATTGRPAPCDVAVTDAQGKLVLESAGFKAGFRCPGAFEKSLPPGRAHLRVTRGPETRAIEKELQLVAGETNELRIALERVVDLRKRGWFAGDSHDHMNHGERTIPVTFDDLASAARAEDLQYLSVAQAWSLEQPTSENLAAEFSRRSRPDCVVTWNLEAPKNYYLGDAGRCLGHCWTLGVRGRTENGQDVIRLLLDASAHDYESDKPTFANFESHALIHAQGGAVFYTHPLRWWMGSWGGQGGYPKVEQMRVSNMAVELPLDTLAGPTYDGIDVITGGNEFKGFELWALLLNHGYRLAAVASSDACFDRPGGAMPGTARTYSHLDGEFSLDAVTRATAQGRTFATTGPLLLATIDGQLPGTKFRLDGKEHMLSIEAWAAGNDKNGLARFEVLRNGSVFFTHRFAPPVSSFQTNLPLAVTDTAWFSVRLFGGSAERDRAITSAFYFDAPGTFPPPPVPARVHVRVLDTSTGKSLKSTLVEVTYLGPVPHNGRSHALPDGEGIAAVPATARLRAEAPGYLPLTLSPFLDNPALVETITRSEDKDLLDWRTYERLRDMLSDVNLTFRLKRE